MIKRKSKVIIMKKLLIIYLLLITGCTPAIISSTPRMVVLGQAGPYNLSESIHLAETECQKYNKHAVQLPTRPGMDMMSYECKD